MRFYRLESVPLEALRYTGEYNASHRWSLPGVHCPTCDATWSGGSEVYPGVDLSELPEAKKLEEGYLEEDFAAFLRLRELLRPLVPASAQLTPGACFGPLVGSARGNFAQLNMQYAWIPLIRREALEQLQAESLRGLLGCRTGLRFRQRSAPELLELQVELHGRLHPDCLPPGRAEPCGTCGRYAFSLPKEPLLDGASLPEARDLFRLSNYPDILVASERLVETIRRLGFEEVGLRELPVR